MAAFFAPAILGLALLGRNVEGASSSSGCDLEQSVPVGQTTNVTLLDDRWFLLYFPDNYDPSTPAPLILSYHGGNRNASEQLELDMLTTPFFNEDYVVVYPNGINVSRTSPPMLRLCTCTYHRPAVNLGTGTVQKFCADHPVRRNSGRASRAWRRTISGSPPPYSTASSHSTASTRIGSSPRASPTAEAS